MMIQMILEIQDLELMEETEVNALFSYRNKPYASAYSISILV